MDITAELAVPLPIQLIAQLLGLPAGDEERLFRWSEAAIPGATDWSEDDRMALLGEMTVELLALAAARRAEPRDDVVSMLATYEEDGEALSDDELGMFLIQLLVAGNETTRNAISGALVALAEHPDQLDRLAADPALIPTAVEEVLRWTTPVTSFLRTAVTDTELGGTAIAAGDPLLLIYAAANRDEAEFGPSAGTFRGRIDRPTTTSRSGTGPTSASARPWPGSSSRSCSKGVVARWRRLSVAGPVVHSGSSVISGIKAAPLTLEPAMSELEGHRVIVTGGGAGIGAATVRALAGLGAQVAVLDRAARRARPPWPPRSGGTPSPSTWRTRTAMHGGGRWARRTRWAGSRTSSPTPGSGSTSPCTSTRTRSGASSWA